MSEEEFPDVRVWRVRVAALEASGREGPGRLFEVDAYWRVEERHACPEARRRGGTR